MDHFLVVFISIFISATIAAAGGIAGGGIIVPLLLVIGGYQFREATILSLSTVFGNYIAQASINIWQRHPRIDSKPLINWDVILVLLPPLLGGANLGVILAKILPSTLLQVTSATVIVYAVHKSYKSFKNHWNEENHQRYIVQHGYKKTNLDEMDDEEAELQPLNVIETDDNIDDNNLNDNSNSINVATNNFDNNEKQSVSSRFKRKSYLHEDFDSDCDSEGSFTSRDTDAETGYPVIDNPQPDLIYPVKSMQVLLCVWLTFVALFVLLQHIPRCSYLTYGLLIALYVALALIVISSIAFVADRQKYDSAFSFAQGDLDLRDQSLRIPSYALVIGVLCALLGIGGGELTGPLFLTYHASPQVTAATVSMMSLLTTASNVLHYLILGDIDLKLSLMLFSMGLVAGFTGRQTALYITNKLQRGSLLVLMLTVVLATSLLLLLYNATLKEVDWSFHSICS